MAPLPPQAGAAAATGQLPAERQAGPSHVPPPPLATAGSMPADPTRPAHVTQPSPAPLQARAEQARLLAALAAADVSKTQRYLRAEHRALTNEKLFLKSWLQRREDALGRKQEALERREQQLMRYGAHLAGAMEDLAQAHKHFQAGHRKLLQAGSIRAKLPLLPQDPVSVARTDPVLPTVTSRPGHSSLPNTQMTTTATRNNTTIATTCAEPTTSLLMCSRDSPYSFDTSAFMHSAGLGKFRHTKESCEPVQASEGSGAHEAVESDEASESVVEVGEGQDHRPTCARIESLPSGEARRQPLELDSSPVPSQASPSNNPSPGSARRYVPIEASIAAAAAETAGSFNAEILPHPASGNSWVVNEDVTIVPSMFTHGQTAEPRDGTEDVNDTGGNSIMVLLSSTQTTATTLPSASATLASTSTHAPKPFIGLVNDARHPATATVQPGSIAAALVENAAVPAAIMRPQLRISEKARIRAIKVTPTRECLGSEPAENVDERPPSRHLTISPLNFRDTS